MALPVCLYYVSALVTAAGRWNSAVWGWCEMRSLLINWFWVLVLGHSIELSCKKLPSYHRPHAGHGAPGSSCSTYTSCHRCHMSIGSYLHSNERARLWVTHRQRLLALTTDINIKTFLWCPVYSASGTTWYVKYQCANDNQWVHLQNKMSEQTTYSNLH